MHFEVFFFSQEKFTSTLTHALEKAVFFSGLGKKKRLFYSLTRFWPKIVKKNFSWKKTLPLARGVPRASARDIQSQIPAVPVCNPLHHKYPRGLVASAFFIYHNAIDRVFTRFMEWYIVWFKWTINVKSSAQSNVQKFICLEMMQVIYKLESFSTNNVKTKKTFSTRTQMKFSALIRRQMKSFSTKLHQVTFSSNNSRFLSALRYKKVSAPILQNSGILFQHLVDGLVLKLTPTGLCRSAVVKLYIKLNL